ncbi:restriction endonuclease [Streptomyces sp. NPDC001118]
MSSRALTAVYLNAGSGGQIAGLSKAGFIAVEAVEADKYCAETLAVNLPGCRIVRDPLPHYVPGDIDPGSLDVLYGRADSPRLDAERDDVPAMLGAVDAFAPKAFVLESPHTILRDRLQEYREFVRERLARLGYVVHTWSRFDSRRYGGPSPWNAAVLVALREDCFPFFDFPAAGPLRTLPLLDVLAESMHRRFERFTHDPRARPAYERWAAAARDQAAPQLVDLTGVDEETAEELYPNDILAWLECGIDVRRISSDDAVGPEWSLFGTWGPCLTVAQAALIKGFPVDWVFSGRSYVAFQQIVAATSPALPLELGRALAQALRRMDDELRQPSPVESNPLAEVDALSPDAFERFVADLLRRDGYRVEKGGGGAGDGGIDIHAYDSWGYPLILQCKHAQDGERRVGAGVVRDLFGAASAMRPIPRAVLVTNGHFTMPCRLWAVTEDRIRLIGREQLESWAAGGRPLHEVLTSERLT